MTIEDAIQYLVEIGISPEHIMELVEALNSSEKPNKWISVETELPEVGIDVLICDLEGTIYLSHRSSFDIYFDELRNKIKGVRAWMPLPQQYTAEGSEE